MGSCSRNRAPGLVTRQQIAVNASELGVAAGDTVMLHAAVGSIGWIVGGPGQVLHGLFDVLGERGTLMMYVGWDGSPYDITLGLEELPPPIRAAWPAFDPAKSHAMHSWSVLAEMLRTWPGAKRSAHPDGSFAAVGYSAEELTVDHPLQYRMGPGSPLAKLCDAKGKILLLGSPLANVTLLHHAEHLADVPGKNVVRYHVPILEHGEKVWVAIEEFSPGGEGCLPWSGPTDMFEAIVRDYVQQGSGSVGRVGSAPSYLFDAADLVAFAVDWIEERFREPVDRHPAEEFTVRPARAEDHRSVAALLRALEEEVTGAPYPESRASSRADELLAMQDRRVFLAETERDVMGMVVASILSPKLGGVDHAYVAPEVRRRGILRELEIEASTFLRDRGCCDVQLHVGAGNEPAREAWRALGYAPTLEVMKRPL